MSVLDYNNGTDGGRLLSFSGLTTPENGMGGGMAGNFIESDSNTLDELREQYFGVHGYISVFVCFFGLLANSANVVVLTRKNMITSTNCILLWLAVSDLLTMLSYLPFAIHFYILYDRDRFKIGEFQTISLGWIKFLMFHASFGIVCHTIAIWLTIALAIFRYIYICMPTKGSIYCSIKRAKIVVFVIYVSTVLILVPNYIINTYNAHNATDSYMELIYSPAPRNDTWFPQEDIITFNYYIQSFFIKLIPCFMLTILTILLILAMHRAYKKRLALKSQGRRDESERHREHNRTTGMLLAIVVLFLITELPQGVLTLMCIINTEMRKIYNIAGDLFDFLALFNNSINFVLYCTMSKQFRDTFFDTFCRCCVREKPGWMKVHLITATNGTKCKSSNTSQPNTTTTATTTTTTTTSNV